MELSKSKAWLVCLVATEAAVDEGCTDCLDQSLWGEKDPTVGCSSQQQDVWIPACY